LIREYVIIIAQHPLALLRCDRGSGMSLARFRCTGKVEVDKLELNNDGVSGSANSKGNSGGLLENVSSYLSRGLAFRMRRYNREDLDI
jgi:hypothetical protein